jgi:hypothetical protein
MLKNRDLSLQIVNSLLNVISILDGTIALVRESKESKKNQLKYIHAIADIIYQIMARLIQEIVKEHPDIAPKGFEVKTKKR